MATDTNFPAVGLEFDHILRAEIAAINQRRKHLGRDELSLEIDGDDRKAINAVGLALSGGGVRSAAFSLGVLQALNHHDVLRHVDYLSTVSGGGYIGSSLTATLSCTEGRFPFGNPPKKNGDQPASEISDTAAVGHLRNYSNYLIPAGARDMVTGVAIMIRGLVANLAWVLAAVLIAAALTILTNPRRTDLGCPDLLGYPLCDYFFAIKNFSLTLVLAVVGLVLFFAWALYRSLVPADRSSEFRTRLPMLASAYLVVVGVVFFVELQTFFLKGLFDLQNPVPEGAATLAGEAAPGVAEARSFEWLTGTLTTLAAILTPLAAIITVFRQQLGAIFKAANASASRSTRMAAALGKGTVWVAGAAVPLVIWVAYLYLSYWGIINNLAVPGPARAQAPTMLQAQTVLAAETIGSAPAETVGRAPADPTKASPDYCTNKLAATEAGFEPPDGAHTPRWMIWVSTWLAREAFCPVLKPVAIQFPLIEPAFDRTLERPMVLLYCLVGAILLLLALSLKPNANSLHRLYRDRLSKAFLFDPREPDGTAAVKRNESSVDQGRDFPQLDRLLVSGLSCRHAPYHLINAALNIQGSDYANRRGRNADFFMFSPCYCGSEATGYASTAALEQIEKGLDLATAMAISGAAASSNMGSASIRPLRPTLALLNIRLGYWLKNPRYVASNGRAKLNGSLRQRLRDLRKAMTPFLWSEISGRLYENSNDVYLTDGGHIENLGVYELLKRRCKLIVAVDGEADFSMNFPSFVTLQRYARIDLGVIVDMPWNTIRKTTCAQMGLHAGADQSPEPAKGPHAAIGRIDYGGGEEGLLLYIKSSLTGDENDYVRDYARRHDLFPHETTGDQFFSEEQFEVYRALGFHAAHCMLAGQDALEVSGSRTPSTLGDTANEVVQCLRTALGLPPVAEPGKIRLAAQGA